MNGRDAFEGEMLFRTLSDKDAEQLLRGRAPEGSEFTEVAEFTQAVRQTLPTRPEDGSALVRQLAEVARTGSPQGAVKTTPVAVPARRRFRLQVPRLVAVAQVAAVLALVPLLFAGLAVAGVSLPEPARDAFKAVGVDLPNQPADDGEESERSDGAEGKQGGGGESGDVTPASQRKAAQEKGQGAKADMRGHGTEQANPARAGGRANGEQSRGRALGKRGLAPGQVVPPGQLKKDEGDKSVGKTNATPPGQSSKPSTGQGNGAPLDKGTASSGAGSEVSKPAKSPKG